MAAKKRCPVCGSGKVRVESPSDYKYEHSGLSHVILMGQGVVKITHCNNCENVTTIVCDEQQLLQVIGLGLLQRPPGLTGEELRYLRTLFDLTQADFASELDLPRRATIAEWERKKRSRIYTSPREEIALRLLLIHLFRARVIESDHCFLQPPHLATYETLVSSFVERISNMLKEKVERPSSRGFGIQRQSRKKLWSPDLVPA